MKTERITFGWDLCYTCDYRCSYCGVWEKKSERDVVMTANEWEKIWDRIYEKYGGCHIYISGGEPATYPYFFELVKKLSQKHFPEICTNLSWDVKKLVPEIPPQRLRIAPTFHPTFADFEVFFEKILHIKSYLPDDQVYHVAYPGQIKKLMERSKRLKRKNIKLVPIPLRGSQEVLNTEEEKELIKSISPYKENERLGYQLKDISPKGKLCRAGFHYAVIRSDGKVDRCSQYQNGSVGNFLGTNFKLFDNPEPCGMEYCPIECQWIIER